MQDSPPTETGDAEKLGRLLESLATTAPEGLWAAVERRLESPSEGSLAVRLTALIDAPAGSRDKALFFYCVAVMNGFAAALLHWGLAPGKGALSPLITLQPLLAALSAGFFAMTGLVLSKLGKAALPLSQRLLRVYIAFMVLNGVLLTVDSSLPTVWVGAVGLAGMFTASGLFLHKSAATLREE